MDISKEDNASPLRNFFCTSPRRVSFLAEMINVKNQHFIFNRILLLSLGLWPYERSKFVQLHLLLCSGVLVSSVACQVRPFNRLLQMPVNSTRSRNIFKYDKNDQILYLMLTSYSTVHIAPIFVLLIALKKLIMIFMRFMVFSK